MTPHQLRTLVVVADTGSVREAAERLYVSQPAVSSVLAGLRSELGVALVEREGRGLRITPAGRVLAAHARRLLGLWDAAIAATLAQADPERGSLRLAAVTTAGEHLVPAPLSTFRQAHPDVEVSLEVGNRARVWDLLDRGVVDLAIGGRPPRGGRLVDLAETENFLVVVSAPAGGGALGGVRSVEVADLAHRTWLVRERGSGTRSTADELLAELGINPPHLTLGSNGALRESAALGLGIALVSRAAVARELAEGTLEEWRAGPLPLRRGWHLVARAGGELSATAALFRDHLLGGELGWLP